MIKKNKSILENLRSAQIDTVGERPLWHRATLATVAAGILSSAMMAPGAMASVGDNSLTGSLSPNISNTFSITDNLQNDTLGDNNVFINGGEQLNTSLNIDSSYSDKNTLTVDNHITFSTVESMDGNNMTIVRVENKEGLNQLGNIFKGNENVNQEGVQVFLEGVEDTMKAFNQGIYNGDKVDLTVQGLSQNKKMSVFCTLRHLLLMAIVPIRQLLGIAFLQKILITSCKVIIPLIPLLN